MSEVQHMFYRKVEVEAERKRRPGVVAGVELERSFEKKGSVIEEMWQRPFYYLRICVSVEVGI